MYIPTAVKNSKYVSNLFSLNRLQFNRIPLDGLVRFFLFPAAVVISIAALVLAVQTYSDLQQSSVSSAFATVQSVQEAYRLETEYPEEVVFSPSERRFDRFWVISESGEVLASSEEKAELSPDIWAFTANAIDGIILDEYIADDEVFVLAGTISADGSYWTIVTLSPPFEFAAVIWLIFAILALSLMSVTGVIAIRFFGTNAAKDISSVKPSIDMDVSTIEVGRNGSSESVKPSFRPDLSKLHEAVLDATEDFVLVLDSDRKIIYSSLQSADLRTDETIDQAVLAGFVDGHLDQKAKSRFEKWLEEGPSERSLIMDVRGLDGQSHASRWVARTLKMKSGTSFDIFVGRRLMVEEFPVPSV